MCNLQTQRKLANAPDRQTNKQCSIMQGIFKQLHSFNEQPTDSIAPIADLRQADPLNIINVALARQQAALRTGCSGGTCADSTNLVNTLYQRHQALLHQTQQASGSGQAGNRGDNSQAAECFPDAVMISGSPSSFQGDSVPDTPVVAAAAEQAAWKVEAAADEEAGRASDLELQDAAADMRGIDLIFGEDTAAQDSGEVSPHASHGIDREECFVTQQSATDALEQEVGPNKVRPNTAMYSKCSCGLRCLVG